MSHGVNFVHLDASLDWIITILACAMVVEGVEVV